MRVMHMLGCCLSLGDSGWAWQAGHQNLRVSYTTKTHSLWVSSVILVWSFGLSVSFLN